MQYRTRIKIISEVLSAALYPGSDGGVSPSVLMRKCNLSYRALEQLVSQLVEAGLLRTVKDERGTTRYAISDKGSQYLKEHLRFQGFMESYGLRL